MEHRWSARKAATGNVIVECPRIGLIQGSLRDISLGGMLVDTESIALPVNAPVAVVFDLPAGDVSDAYCLQAMVVRRNARGMAIMFLDPDPDILRSIRGALYGSNGAGAPPRHAMTVERSVRRAAALRE